MPNMEEKIKRSIIQIVDYLRNMDEAYSEGLSDVSGKQELVAMFQNGQMPLSKYMKILECLNHPEKEVEVIFIK